MRTHLTVSMLLAAAALPALSRADAPCGEWSVVPTPVPPGAAHAIVRDIVAIAPDDAWAVGGWSGNVDGVFQTFAFTMHWDGEAWTLIDTPQPAPCGTCHNLTLWGVDATGPNDVWAAGGAVVQAPDGFVGTHILVMHWDGSEWEVMKTPVQVGASGDILWRVEAIAPDDVWFFGENLYADYPLLLDLAIALHWDGSGFEFVELPIVNFKNAGFGDGNSLHAGSALAPDDIWAVGAAGDGDDIACDLSQIHHWNGEKWEHVPAGPPDGCFWHSLDAVEAIAPDDVWAGGYSFDGAYHGLALHWNGGAWSEVPTPIGITDFLAFGSDDIFAVGGGVAHWDGKAWTVVETFSQVDGPSIAGADAAGPCHAWAGGRQIVDGLIMPFTARLLPTGGCAPDLDGNGILNLFDFLAFTNLFNKGDTAADFDGNGVLNLFDFLAFTNAFNAGC